MIKELNLKFKIKENPHGIKREAIILTVLHLRKIEVMNYAEKHGNRAAERRFGLLRRHSSPYCCWSLLRISADGTFSPTRNLITMRCSTLRGTFCSLITLATPRQDWTGSNPSRREGGGCGFTLSRSHSCCAVRLVYIQISPGHIWTTLYYDRIKGCENEE